METQNEMEDFVYTYSAKEQDEVRRIRQKYQPVDEVRRRDIESKNSVSLFL